MRHRILALALCTAACGATPALADTGRDKLPQIFTMSPTGVNLQTGMFVHSQTDFTIGSLSFVRSWRAVPTYSPNPALAGGHHAFGGWNHNYGIAARWHPTRSDGVNIYAEGKVFQFVLNNAGTTWTPWNIEQHNNNAFGTHLSGTVGSNLVFTNKSGDVYSFNADNLATRIDYADGTRVMLAYDAAKRLKTVISSRGDAIVLDYGPGGQLSAACGYNRAVTYVDPLNATCAAAPVKATYQHAATSAAQGWVLASVTDPGGSVTSMQYDSYHRPNLTCITVPNSPTCRITNFYGAQPSDLDPTNTDPDQVRRQVTATGEVWQYFYSGMGQYIDWPPIQGGEIRPTSSHMTDPLGRVTDLLYENGFLKRLVAPEGITEYSWASLNPSVFVAPEKNSERLLYDLNNNLKSRTWKAKPGSDLPDIVIQWGYPDPDPGIFPTGCVAASRKLCDKPLFQIDAKGNRTDFTYDPAHGQILTETGPAVTSGGVQARPQKRYTYQQRYAGVKNSAGTIVAAETPVWILTEERQCKTQGSCAGTADEVRAVYEYADTGTADALRPKGVVADAGGLSLRTCYAYDVKGNKISETRPKALASCVSSPPPSSPVFSIADAAAVNEGGTAVFTVTKSGSASGSLSVNFATANSSAAAPGDYAAQSGTLTFLASETSKTINVATVADSIAEPLEQFSVSLSSPSAGASIGIGTGTGTINASGSGGGGGANQPPVTNADSFTTTKCGTVSLNVVQNDSDPDGHYPLSLVSVGTTSFGVTSVESSTNVKFKSTNNTGSGSFTYTVSDSLGATATGTVNFTVNPFSGGGGGNPIIINPSC